jgi:hypothetical protein
VRAETLYFLRCVDLIAPALIGKLQILATISAIPLRPLHANALLDVPVVIPSLMG